MGDIWGLAKGGYADHVAQLVGQDPGLLNAKNGDGWTPLISASRWSGHMSVVRVLLDLGAAVNEPSHYGRTALWFACRDGYTTVVGLLMERGADPTIADRKGWSPLMVASDGGHLDVVCLLLRHPSARATVNRRSAEGETPLWRACQRGYGAIVRALLDSGADFTTVKNRYGVIPKRAKDSRRSRGVTAEGRRECVAALEVRSCLPLPPSLSIRFCEHPTEAWGVVLGMVAGGRAGLPALEGPAGGRPAGKRRGGGAGAAGRGSRKGTGGLRGSSAKG
jgi:hypothetical protein